MARRKGRKTHGRKRSKKAFKACVARLKRKHVKKSKRAGRCRYYHKKRR